MSQYRVACCRRRPESRAPRAPRHCLSSLAAQGRLANVKRIPCTNPTSLGRTSRRQSVPALRRLDEFVTQRTRSRTLPCHLRQHHDPGTGERTPAKGTKEIRGADEQIDRGQQQTDPPKAARLEIRRAII